MLYHIFKDLGATERYYIIVIMSSRLSLLILNDSGDSSLYNGVTALQHNTLTLQAVSIYSCSDCYSTFPTSNSIVNPFKALGDCPYSRICPDFYK